jgi:hypothetical protein
MLAGRKVSTQMHDVAIGMHNENLWAPLFERAGLLIIGN